MCVTYSCLWRPSLFVHFPLPFFFILVVFPGRLSFSLSLVKCLLRVQSLTSTHFLFRYLEGLLVLSFYFPRPLIFLFDLKSAPTSSSFSIRRTGHGVDELDIRLHSAVQTTFHDSVRENNNSLKKIIPTHTRPSGLWMCFVISLESFK